MKKDRRWIKSVIATSADAMPVLPWARGTRRRPMTLQPARPAPVRAER